MNTITGINRGKNWPEIIFLSGKTLLLWLAFLFCFSSLLQFCRIEVSRAAIYFSCLFFVFIISQYALKEKVFNKKKSLLYFWGAFGITILFTLLVAGYFYDYSYDGQAYHGEAILQLANGWNPVYEKLPEQKLHALWNNHYPKATWITEAAVYKITGIYESAKAVNLLLIIANGCILFYTLTSFKFFTLFTRILICLFIALDPINLNMLFSFYVDGQMASLMSILTCLLILAFYKPGCSYQMALCGCIIYLANVKFTSIAYLGVYGIGITVLILLLKKTKQYRRLFLLYVCSCIAGVVIFGYSSYVYNTINFKHPFYPLAGKNKVSVIDSYIPAGFNNQNRVTNFLFSSFAKTSYVDNFKKPVQLKIPLTASKKEIERYAFAGVMIGGFGIWFSAILLFSALFLIFGFINEKNKRTNKLFFFLIAIILFSVFVNPASWWARYVPQFWLIPFISFIYYSRTAKSKKWPQWLFFFIVFINAAVTGGAYCYYNFVVSKKVKEQFAVLKSSGNPVILNFGNHTAKRIHFIENNITYKEVGRDSLISPDTILRTEIIYKK
jgi:hypothetical protein